MQKKRRLLDEYRFSGFNPYADIQGVFGDSRARVIRLKRSQKKPYADVAAQLIGAITTRPFAVYGIYPAGMQGYIWKWRFGGYSAGNAGK